MLRMFIDQLNIMILVSMHPSVPGIHTSFKRCISTESLCDGEGLHMKSPHQFHETNSDSI